MQRKTAAQGALLGGIAGLLLLGLLYLANQAFGTPFVPYDFWNWQARVIPRNLLSLAVAGIGGTLARLLGTPESVWGKAAEQLGSLLLFVGVLAIAGSFSAWIKRRARQETTKAGLWSSVVLFILVTLLELGLGLRRPLLALIWLAIAFLGWGTLVDSILNGRIFASLSAATDKQRRLGLLKLAGSAVGAALAAWGLGRLISTSGESTGADQPLTDAVPVTPTQPTAQEPEVPSQLTPIRPTESAPEIPTGDDGRIAPVPGTREEITPRGAFYRVDINASPLSLDGDVWRLVMAGLFDQPTRLTRDDLRAYPTVTQPITLSCISNPVGGSSISTAHWTGLRLSDLLDDLGLQPEANYLYVQAADGFYETVPMEDMMNPRTLLVYGMNGRSLPDKHGFPLRIYIPNRYGMKQPKWIERIEATETDKGGYWTDRGWSKQAIPNTTSVVDVVAVDLAQNGYIPVGGVAWAGARDIQKVEVQIDGGNWFEATLRTPSLGPLAWVQWRYEWRGTPGSHTIKVRATDGTGQLQTERERGTLPDGATGYHSVKIDV